MFELVIAVVVAWFILDDFKKTRNVSIMSVRRDLVKWRRAHRKAIKDGN